jgi:hypothetical protein
MQADLTQFLKGPADIPMVIQTKEYLWCDIGTGQFATYNSQQVSFEGRISHLSPGLFSLGLTITDDTACLINLNGHEIAGTYTLNDDELVVAVSDGPYDGIITIEIWHGGTWIDSEVSGVLDHILWIGPESSLKRRPRG